MPTDFCISNALRTSFWNNKNNDSATKAIQGQREKQILQVLKKRVRNLNEEPFVEKAAGNITSSLPFAALQAKAGTIICT